MWMKYLSLLLIPLLITISPVSIGAGDNSSDNGLTEKRKAEIAHMVKQDCGSCHGLTLKGGLGPSLDPVRLNLYPENFLEITISHGRPGTPMPPWAPILTGNEIHYIATHLLQGTWYEK